MRSTPILIAIQVTRMHQEDLVRRFLDHRDATLAYIFALTRDYDAAEEIFQDVAVTIIQEAEKAGRIDHFDHWLREVARHRVADYYRRTGRRLAKEQPTGSMADVVSQAFEENAASPEENHARMKLLIDCVQGLNGRSREVINGFYRELKSLKELAASLCWKESSTKVALSRARKTLAECVEGKLRARQVQ